MAKSFIILVSQFEVKYDVFKGLILIHLIFVVVLTLYSRSRLNDLAHKPIPLNIIHYLLISHHLDVLNKEYQVCLFFLFVPSAASEWVLL
jgi:hypothetical protein